ncbi:MAG TPA: hypothetical protein ENL10_03165 [Candidatus Cloacimonetes bacterium]|nr:hypothetical protein [Candidatus Cloacimonadota bacterium]
MIGLFLLRLTVKKHKYVRINEPSNVHFITNNTYKKQPFFLQPKCCEILLCNIDHYRKELGYKILGYCIMPNHVHLLIWFEVYKKSEQEQDKPALNPSVIERKDTKLFSSFNRRGFRSGLSRTNEGSIVSAEAPLNISKIMHRIKGKTAIDIRKKIEIDFKWEKYIYDFNIYTIAKFKEKLNYIHNNQFKDSRIHDPDSYPYSSMIFLETGKGVLKVDEIEL